MPPSRPKTRATRATLASRSDPYDLYQHSVQSVDAEIDFVDETCKALRARHATLLREDFCGTFNTACEWVRRRPANLAVAVDLDPKPLAWGRAHNLTRLTDHQKARLTIKRANVLAQPKPALVRARSYDVVLAMNFSYWCFKTRPLLLRYFRSVHRSLTTNLGGRPRRSRTQPRGQGRRGGLFFLDFYGGPDALRQIRELRRCPARRAEPPTSANPRGTPARPRFTYVWDQHEYNPITGDLLCHIDFRFPDGSRIRRAFTYHWRLWTIPEIRDALADAGFARSTVYWEGDDGKGGGDGDFRPTDHGEPCPAYIAYIVAER